jgi:hypothetical protein
LLDKKGKNVNLSVSQLLDKLWSEIKDDSGFFIAILAGTAAKIIAILLQ